MRLAPLDTKTAKGPVTYGAAGAKPREEERDWTFSARQNGRIVSALIRDSVGVGTAVIEGEVEPQHDGAYERHTLTLMRRQGGGLTNANDFEFVASLDWPGPLVAFLAHDKAGKAIARADLNNPRQVAAGTRIVCESGHATFSPIEPRSDGADQG
jgi:hypothetical protein